MDIQVEKEAEREWWWNKWKSGEEDRDQEWWKFYKSYVIMKRGWYRSLKEQFSKFRQHLNTEKVQWGCGGLGKSTELCEVKQHPLKKNKKKKTTEIVSVANKSAEESSKVCQSSFSSLAAARDKLGKCVEEKD